MTSSFRSTQLLLAAACVCVAVAGSPIAHSQAAPTAAQQKKSAKPVQGVPLAFHEFFVTTGEEDQTIKREIESGKTPVTPRRDYATLLGISKDEEQTMLSIIIDAFHQARLGEMDESNACDDHIQQYGHDEGWRMCNEDRATHSQRERVASKEAAAKLQAQLGEEFLAKLTAYLNSAEHHKYGYVNGIAVDLSNTPDPCPPNNNPPPGQTTHQACADAYESHIFGEIGMVDKQNERVATLGESEGNKPDRFHLFDGLPENIREAAIAIGREANRKIEDNDQQFYPAASKYFDQCYAKYGLEIAQKMPLPPELQALEKQRPIIVEEYISKLRQEVGEDFFNILDVDLSKNKKRILHVPISVPAEQQKRAVQP